MTSTFGWQRLFMRSPTQFGRLTAFADKAINRPGVDEFTDALGNVGHLGIAFGNMYDFDPQLLGQRRPLFARIRHRHFHAGISCNIEQRLFDQMRHQSRIGAVSD